MAFLNVQQIEKLIRFILFFVLPLLLTIVILQTLFLQIIKNDYKHELASLTYEIRSLKEQIADAQASQTPAFRKALSRAIGLNPEAGTVFTSETQLEPESAIDGVKIISYLPEFIADKPVQQGAITAEGNEKTAYLTFDDGPSARTLEILAILEREQIKGTFFVVNKTSEAEDDILRQIIAAGHIVGMHSATHDYKKVYSSTESFVSDLKSNYDYIKQVTGYLPSVFRFPGGSTNSYNNELVGELLSDMNRRGFLCFDWNCATGDASAARPDAQEQLQNVITTANNQKRLVILAHDSTLQKATVEALPSIIAWLRAEGYGFDVLDSNSEQLVFSKTMASLIRYEELAKTAN